MFPHHQHLSDIDRKELENYLEVLESQMNRLISEIERDYHHCETMPPELSILRGRHPEMHNGKWAEWQWEINGRPKNGSIFFCIYCMEDLPKD